MKKEKIGHYLAIITGAMFIFSALGKFLQPAPLVEVFAGWGMADAIWIVASLELLAAVLLVIPKTRKLGNLMFTAYFGGAIATHVAHREFFMAIVPAIIMGFIWLVTSLQDPKVFVQ